MYIADLNFLRAVSSLTVDATPFSKGPQVPPPPCLPLEKRHVDS